MDFHDSEQGAEAGTAGLEASGVREAALAYLGRGYRVVPIPHGQKGPNLPDWQNLQIEPEGLGEFFPPGEDRNVGIILGEPSGGLVDVDLDCPEAACVAVWPLPDTGMTHGRASNPRSHWWYVAEGEAPKTKRFTDLEKGALVELRGTGGQTMVPPSRHPSGEAVWWEGAGEPARVPTNALLRSVGRVAAAALLARHWPEEGARQDAALALSGALGREGWGAEEVKTFVEAVAKAAKDDEKSKRAETAGPSVKKAQAGEPVTGWTTLAELVGIEVVRRVCQFLGCKAPSGKADEQGGQVTEGRASGKRSEQLVRLVTGRGAELFHDSGGHGFVALDVGGHREVFPLGSKSFRTWLAQEAVEVSNELPAAGAIQDAVEALKGHARFRGPEKEVFLRVGTHAGKNYLDLGTPEWSAVEVAAEGWRVVARPPAYFRRSSGMLPLPSPDRSRAVELEWFGELLNLGDERNVRMVTAWLLACLRPTGPYPLLVLYGEQGSAKSSAARALRSFVDPPVRPLRPCPRNDKDLAAAVQNNWLVGLDNVSVVRDWMSDCLCQVATGAGFSSRELYTDFEEVGVGGARPIVLNGISPQMISRADLLDRCLMVGLPVINGGRLTEVEVNRRLDLARPGILAGLLDGVSAGLRNKGLIQMPPLPRMADFASWAEECGEGLG